ncbi:hypothetical protein [Draconibacterium sediminis]|uniref:Uncharacterized protein n=1 Tax=Draconibacterium sediminis TaxID=1544798 RepID=A0A0D8J987_9BACT|nr:hypothetical protein [Draconibacterium sediminis]KJF43096.1 hypothetical protein LH29_17100 [Draconibacterium sediminis]
MVKFKLEHAKLNDMEFMRIESGLRSLNLNPSAINQNLDLEYILEFNANDYELGTDIIWTYSAVSDNETIIKARVSDIYTIKTDIGKKQLNALLEESFGTLSFHCSENSEITLKPPVLTADIVDLALLRLKSVLHDRK